MNFRGHPVKVNGETTPNQQLFNRVNQVQAGEIIGHVEEVYFRNPNHFRAGELHNHYSVWQDISHVLPPDKQSEILGWIKKFSVEPYFQPYKERFKAEEYNSDRPPHRVLPNNPSCRPFASFVRKVLFERLQTEIFRCWAA